MRERVALYRQESTAATYDTFYKVALELWIIRTIYGMKFYTVISSRLIHFCKEYHNTQ